MEFSVLTCSYPPCPHAGLFPPLSYGCLHSPPSWSCQGHTNSFPITTSHYSVSQVPCNSDQPLLCPGKAHSLARNGSPRSRPGPEGRLTRVILERARDFWLESGLSATLSSCQSQSSFCVLDPWDDPVHHSTDTPKLSQEAISANQDAHQLSRLGHNFSRQHTRAGRRSAADKQMLLPLLFSLDSSIIMIYKNIQILKSMSKCNLVNWTRKSYSVCMHDLKFDFFFFK